MSTRRIEGRREIAPGRSAYWQAWLPQCPTQDPSQGPIRASVVMVHGLHEHSARYAHVGTRLATAGFATYAADHRGHGRSDGRPANIERMALIVEDLGSFVHFALERHPGLPVFMVGHSLGGLIALQYATEAKAVLDGLVVSGPTVQVLAGSALARRLAGLLSAVVPNLGVVPIDDQKISRDPEVVRAYRADPLVYHGKVKARTGAEMLVTMEGLPSRLGRLSLPLLLLHGTEDQICALAGSVMVHDAVSSPDKTLHRYQGLYHEVFNEPEREAILTDLVSWLTEHLPTNRGAPHSAG
ncbi:MAG: lysophospholipase [Pseudonocardiales bacterium]|nr:lysophospholipase [Pseudonocardiales bacterium]